MVVLDSCAAFQIASRTKVGEALLSVIDSGEKIVVPRHFDVEFINTLSKYVRGSHITHGTAVLYLEEISKLITKRVDIEDYIDEVLYEASNLNHNAYDVFYLVIARRYRATLLTVDKRLVQLCESTGVNTVEIVPW